MTLTEILLLSIFLIHFLTDLFLLWAIKRREIQLDINNRLLDQLYQIMKNKRG